MTAGPGGERLEELRRLVCAAKQEAYEDLVRLTPFAAKRAALDAQDILDAALVAVCQDAERLDWLEAHRVDLEIVSDVPPAEPCTYIRGYSDGATLREAIDAARGGPQEGNAP